MRYNTRLRKPQSTTKTENRVWFIAGLMIMVVYAMYATLFSTILYQPVFDEYGHKIVRLHDHVQIGVLDTNNAY